MIDSRSGPTAGQRKNREPPNWGGFSEPTLDSFSGL